MNLYKDGLIKKKVWVFLNSYSFASQINHNTILHCVESRLHKCTQRICQKQMRRGFSALSETNAKFFPKNAIKKIYLYFNYTKPKDLCFELAFMLRGFNVLQLSWDHFSRVVFPYPRKTRKSCLKLWPTRFTVCYTTARLALSLPSAYKVPLAVIYDCLVNVYYTDMKQENTLPSIPTNTELKQRHMKHLHYGHTGR